MAKEKPDTWLDFSHEAVKKGDKNEDRHTDGIEVFTIKATKADV